MIDSSVEYHDFWTKTAAIVKSCLCFVSYKEKIVELMELERGYNTRQV